MNPASWTVLSVSWERMESWHWWGVAVLLVIFELLSPAFFCLWLGFAALVVGGVLALFPALDWRLQWFGFAGLSLLSLIVWHGFWKRRFKPSTSTLNRRGVQLVGRLLTLDVPLVGGAARVRVDDSSWKVVGPDLPVGACVRVTAIEGLALRVEPVNPPPG
ncbi:MAG: NfeD family protein [Magnetococcales bacterium]|nr:NfeD family protein [Magnetococcales bacterium]